MTRKPIDVEVYGKHPGPYPWHAYRDVHEEVASGVARNRFTLALALIWVAFRYGSTR